MAAGRQAHTPGTKQDRLPWWALALPAVAFLALFSLLAPSASANTGEGAGRPGGGSLVHVVRLVQHAVVHRAP
ncbi:hypothetical protein AB0A70_23250 [Streptomyces morookaense]|uniref:hypothetical protein n=1 Tax=Streptomyces morookaense TaxID=1970 RepID=UPI0033CBA354